MTTAKRDAIVAKARQMGAALAGIASVELLKKSPSHEISGKIGVQTDRVGSAPGAAGFDEIQWPNRAKSALVIAVSHPEGQPELDWWDGFRGSPGNRVLIRINRELSAWLEETLGIKTHKIPYHINKGGIYLKDAATLAGLGCIGKNNLLITSKLGPRVRLRAMLLEEELAPTGPLAFDPCSGCPEFCRDACPQNAFSESVYSPIEMGVDALPGRSGCFSRTACWIQMDTDVEDSGVVFDTAQPSQVDVEELSGTRDVIKYCRQCELACPVGR